LIESIEYAKPAAAELTTLERPIRDPREIANPEELKHTAVQEH